MLSQVPNTWRSASKFLCLSFLDIDEVLISTPFYLLLVFVRDLLNMYEWKPFRLVNILLQ